MFMHTTSIGIIAGGLPSALSRSDLEGEEENERADQVKKLNLNNKSLIKKVIPFLPREL